MQSMSAPHDWDRGALQLYRHVHERRVHGYIVSSSIEADTTNLLSMYMSTHTTTQTHVYSIPL